MAEYITLPTNILFEVPENVTDEQAVFVEPLAAACEITEQLHIEPTAKVLVLGDGKLGLTTALTLNALNLDVLLVANKQTDYFFVHHVIINIIKTYQGLIA